jgi:hypothetical protein
MLPRALATVKSRNATTPALQSYIDAYLSVQVHISYPGLLPIGLNVFLTVQRRYRSRYADRQ